jgi:hypothetical protein
MFYATVKIGKKRAHLGASYQWFSKDKKLQKDLNKRVNASTLPKTHYYPNLGLALAHFAAKVTGGEVMSARKTKGKKGVIY